MLKVEVVWLLKWIFFINIFVLIIREFELGKLNIVVLFFVIFVGENFCSWVNRVCFFNFLMVWLGWDGVDKLGGND